MFAVVMFGGVTASSRRWLRIHRIPQERMRLAPVATNHARGDVATAGDLLARKPGEITPLHPFGEFRFECLQSLQCGTEMDQIQLQRMHQAGGVERRNRAARELASREAFALIADFGEQLIHHRRLSIAGNPQQGGQIPRHLIIRPLVMQTVQPSIAICGVSARVFAD